MLDLILLVLYHFADVIMQNLEHYAKGIPNVRYSLNHWFYKDFCKTEYISYSWVLAFFSKTSSQGLDTKKVYVHQVIRNISGERNVGQAKGILYQFCI